jgi:hypothetical protein
MIYRRLPAFLIATIDKFASLPWEGRTGKLFGKATHVLDGQGYYGPADGEEASRGVQLADRLDPPDLVMQRLLDLSSTRPRPPRFVLCHHGACSGGARPAVCGPQCPGPQRQGIAAARVPGPDERRPARLEERRERPDRQTPSR